MAQDGPKLTPLGKLVVFLFIFGCLGGGAFMLLKGSFGGGENPENAGNDQGSSSGTAATNNNTPAGPAVSIGVAYGTEKKRWLKWAVEEFKKTDAGKRITVNLIPMGSLEAAKAVLAKDKRIHVWSPASAAYTDVFIQDWEVKHGGNPILSSEQLVLSPMVFVMWKDRYEAFKQHQGEVNFDSLRKAVKAETGWTAVANKPEWGYFKYGHTNPKESNSGVLALVLSAYDFHKKSRDLQLKDIVDPAFQKWYRELGTGITGLPNSTGNMMHEMVLKGPSTYDVVWVYENLAMSYFENARGRSGEFAVIYPEKNMWNDNPYYRLNVEWSSKDQRDATKVFQDFLLSERIQKRAVQEGFRPANLAVSLKGSESPFTKYAPNGIKLDLPIVCDPPKAEVLNNLLLGWERLRSNR